ncbi:hypothetical protein ACFSKN_08575 [Mariniflexile gromovii]|uniref:DUF4177 domain-containing protein n=1 Tax=Mariniflexile gromovii TaxID=362523 RepID=A0ABS4BU33_9FLAO|nr:hypothetical protein [Mariniflexile gromovii]MBP0904095.1 hypothetical protein [Mariniflexile gromovii]
MKTKHSISIPISAIVILVLCISLWSFNTKDATQTSTKQYCELIFDERVDPKTAFNNKHEYLKSSWANYSNYPYAETENNILKTFTRRIDALNYLSANGWKLIDHYHLTFSNGYTTQDFYLMEK